MRIVAEGVEDTKALTILKTFGCDYIQGYIVAKPMPHNEFLQWLENYSIAEQPFSHLYGETSSKSEQQHTKKHHVDPKPEEKEELEDFSDIIKTELEDFSDILENTTIDQNDLSVDSKPIDIPTNQVQQVQELIDIKSLPKSENTNNSDIIDLKQKEPEIEIIEDLTYQSSPNKKPEKEKDLLSSIDFGDNII